MEGLVSDLFLKGLSFKTHIGVLKVCFSYKNCQNVFQAYSCPLKSDLYEYGNRSRMDALIVIISINGCTFLHVCQN